MNAKIKALTDMLSVIGLSEEEQVLLMQRLREMWHISEEDSLPTTEVSDKEARVEEYCSETQTVVVQKKQRRVAAKVSKTPHYSKNGKRLGRPPRKTQVQPETAEIVEPVVATTEETADTTTEETTGQRTVNVTAAAGRQNKSAAPVLDKVTHLVDAEEIEKTNDLKMGKRYDFAIIYRWDDRLYVKSHYILSGMFPEGVCINYDGYARREYTQFAISLTDEVPGLTLKEAMTYAANQLPQFEGKRWDVMSAAQQVATRKVASELNKLLRKLSGDLFSGKYATGDGYEMLLPGIKIRYAIDIR